MTDKELLEFCKEHNVELGISYDPDRDSYHLRIRRGLAQINDMVSSEYVGTVKDWNGFMRYELCELENRLSRIEKDHEKET